MVTIEKYHVLNNTVLWTALLQKLSWNHPDSQTEKWAKVMNRHFTEKVDK